MLSSLPSDVWSYGVLLWELASQKAPDILTQEGKTKGPLMTNLLKLLEDGARLHVDSTWPAWYRLIMLQCWAPLERERPSFKDVIARGEW